MVDMKGFIAIFRASSVEPSDRNHDNIFSGSQISEIKDTLRKITPLVAEVVQHMKAQNQQATAESKKKLDAELQLIQNLTKAAYSAACARLLPIDACEELGRLLNDVTAIGHTFSYTESVAQCISTIRKGCLDLIALYEM